MQTLIYIGAGQGKEAKELINKGYDSVFLVEPQPDLAEGLRQLLEQSSTPGQVIEAAVTPEQNLNQIYQYNLPEAASLYQATELKALFPGLKIKNTQAVSVLSPEALLKQAQTESNQPLHLVIDAPGSEQSILEDLASRNQLESLAQLWVTSPEVSYYESGAQASEIQPILLAQGFELVECKTDHPDWPQWRFQRNALKDQLKQIQEKLRANEQQLQESQKQALAKQEALTQERDQLKKERDQLKKDKEALSAEKEKLKEQIKSTEEKLAETQKWFAGRKKQALESEETIKELQQKLELIQKDLEHAQKELKNQEEQNSQLKKLQERLDYLFNQQTLQLEQAANALGQHITQRSQQGTEDLKSFIQVQQQLGRNTQALSYNNQQLDAPLALYLNQKLSVQSYDLILDLGAGVSTHFLAHLLHQQNTSALRLNKSGRQQPEAYPVAEEGELPKRILAFTHQRKIGQELTEHLKDQGQHQLADILFTPLVDCRLNGQDYLYYDASKTLSRIADLLEKRQGKLLALLNLEQQPEQLNPEASLPSLLQHLASQSLEVVIYPLNHPKTGQMQDTWTQLLNQRELEYQLQEDPHNNSLVFKIN